MKNKEKLYSAFLASIIIVLFFVLAPSTAFAEAMQSSSPKITETRITTSGAAGNPDIHNNRIVWGESRNENTDIYMYDASSKKETRITTNPSSSGNPAIYGNKIVWHDDRNGNSDIFILDLATKKQISTTNKSDQINPDIYKDRVVWEDYRNGNSDNPKSEIYLQDLLTKKQTRITSSGIARNPKIYENRIIWEEWGTDTNGRDYPNVFLYDIFTKKQTQISKTSPAYYPNIYGNGIVWGSYESAVVYDLYTKKETKIPTDHGGKTFFTDIYKDKVVWAEGCLPGEGDCQMYDLYLYDLSTSNRIQLTNSGAPKREVSIYGNRIVWEDGRNGDYMYDSKPDIYMVTLSYAPVTAFSASPLSGKAPLTVKFIDKSTNNPTSWSWKFGDGTSSTTKNPTHKYAKAGKYTVTLTVKNEAGSNTVKKGNYISVENK